MPENKPKREQRHVSISNAISRLSDAVDSLEELSTKIRQSPRCETSASVDENPSLETFLTVGTSQIQSITDKIHSIRAEVDEALF